MTDELLEKVIYYIGTLDNPTEKVDIFKYAWDILKGTSAQNPLSTPELTKKIAEKNNKPQYKIYRTLLEFTRDEKIPLGSKQGAGGGYFSLEPDASKFANNEENDNEDFFDQNLQAYPEATQEKHIWPLIELWLKDVKGIKNTSCEFAHNKKNGKWGNPDVVSLIPLEKMGFFDVSVLTVEVKTSLTDWGQYFFEAVAHKRFSNRVYFAYRATGQEGSGDKDILSYAERFRVGVLRLDISDDDYRNLVSWPQFTDEQKIVYLENIVEEVPAPYEIVPLEEKIKFMRNLGLSDKDNIYSFGLG